MPGLLEAVTAAAALYQFAGCCLAKASSAFVIEEWPPLTADAPPLAAAPAESTIAETEFPNAVWGFIEVEPGPIALP